MSESDGNRKRAASSASTEDGSTSTTARAASPPPPVLTNGSGLSSIGAGAAPATVAPPTSHVAAPSGGSKKKQKKGTRGSSAAGAQTYVPPGVVISRSAEDCAPQLSLSKDQLIITGNKGFRMARATHGVSNGTWYWECTVLPPETREGHCRLGWSLSPGSLQGPVGYDKFSYAYRDIAGSKVHESLRTDNYGEAWGTGDVIGFLIKLKSPSPEELRDSPDGALDSGRLTVAAAAATLAAAGGSASERAAAATGGGTGANSGNEIRFFKNGRDQKVAFSGIKPGTYYPAVSLYMGGTVRANFGPEFVYPPPSSLRWKPIANLKPLSKDEIKAQRTRTKRERAARGLETATRLSAGGAYLGNTSRSPPSSATAASSASGPGNAGKTGAQQKGGNGNGGAGTRSSKSSPSVHRGSDERDEGEAAPAAGAASSKAAVAPRERGEDVEEQKSGGMDGKTSTGGAQKTSREKVNEDRREGGGQGGTKTTTAASVEKVDRAKEQGESEKASRASPELGHGRPTAGSGESSKKKKRPRKEDASNGNEGRKVARHDDNVRAAETMESPSIGDEGISVATVGASSRISSKGQNKKGISSTISVSKTGESRGKHERNPVSMGVAPPQDAPAESMAVEERRKSPSKADRLNKAEPDRNDPPRVDGERRPMEVDRSDTDSGNGVRGEAASITDTSKSVYR